MGVTLHASFLNPLFLISLSDPTSENSIIPINIPKKSTLVLDQNKEKREEHE